MGRRHLRLQRSQAEEGRAPARSTVRQTGPADRPPAYLRAHGAAPVGLFGTQVSRRADPVEREAEQIVAAIRRGDTAGERRRLPAPAEPDSLPPHARAAVGGPGIALDPATRARLEPALGLDLGAVRLHTDARAAASATAVGAAAYTAGRHIVFSAGQYALHTAAGRDLLDHEVAHVAQQIVGGMSFPQLLRRELPGEGTTNLPTLGQPLELQLSQETVALLGMLTLDGFVIDSALLTDDHLTALRSYASTMSRLQRQHPGTFEIVGHTDATGTEAHNQELGQRRADMVRDMLELFGLPGLLMSTRSAGESEPRVTTDAPEPMNRRVEVRFRPLAARLGGPAATPGPPTVPDLLRPNPRIFDLPPRPGPLRPAQPEFPPWMWNPNFPGPARPSVTPNQLLDRALEGSVGRILDGLGVRGWARERIMDGARAAVDRGIEAALDGALDAAQIQGEAREAITGTVRALREQPITP
jgi:hypothetical protein